MTGSELLMSELSKIEEITNFNKTMEDTEKHISSTSGYYVFNHDCLRASSTFSYLVKLVADNDPLLITEVSKVEKLRATNVFEDKIVFHIENSFDGEPLAYSFDASELESYTRIKEMDV